LSNETFGIHGANGRAEHVGEKRLIRSRHAA
jgi:hypothetical protein